MQHSYEVHTDGSPHPAAAFKDPRAKWKAHVRYVGSEIKGFNQSLAAGQETVRQHSWKRTAVEKTNKPSDEAQLALINAFDPFHMLEEGSVQYAKGRVHWDAMNADEAIAAALSAMDDIAESIRQAGGKVSFTRQRARRQKLEAIEALIEREDHALAEWADNEKQAMKRACPDFDRLGPKFVVIDSLDPNTPPGTVTTL